MPANSAALAAATEILKKKKKSWKGVSTYALGQMLSEIKRLDLPRSNIS